LGPNWPLHDLTNVGESSGTALSGGQILRIGVARAVYADVGSLKMPAISVSALLSQYMVHTAVLLLDDPFSALDSVTATKLMVYLQQVGLPSHNITWLRYSHSGRLQEAESSCHTHYSQRGLAGPRCGQYPSS
jgi:ABC-type nitrate/sulfonate/bicarbonate transport system ATPase subunit